VSHIVTIQTQVRDPAAVRAACSRLGLVEPTEGIGQLFSGEVRGLVLELPGWTYPVVIDTAAGAVHFDNYGGRWGEQAQLDRFLQGYAVEKAKLEARQQGYQVSEQPLQDGSILVRLSGGN